MSDQPMTDLDGFVRSINARLQSCEAAIAYDRATRCEDHRILRNRIDALEAKGGDQVRTGVKEILGGGEAHYMTVVNGVTSDGRLLVDQVYVSKLERIREAAYRVRSLIHCKDLVAGACPSCILREALES